MYHNMLTDVSRRPEVQKFHTQRLSPRPFPFSLEMMGGLASAEDAEEAADAIAVPLGAAELPGRAPGPSPSPTTVPSPHPGAAYGNPRSSVAPFDNSVITGNAEYGSPGAGGGKKEGGGGSSKALGDLPGAKFFTWPMKPRRLSPGSSGPRVPSGEGAKVGERAWLGVKDSESGDGAGGRLLMSMVGREEPGELGS